MEDMWGGRGGSNKMRLCVSWLKREEELQDGGVSTFPLRFALQTIMVPSSLSQY